MTIATTTREVTTDRIANLRAQLAQEEANLRAFDELTPVQQLATDIHELTCHQDHTEYCGWFYENWNDQREHSTRQRYVTKARNILAITDAATALAVLVEAKKF